MLELPKAYNIHQTFDLELDSRVYCFSHRTTAIHPVYVAGICTEMHHILLVHVKDTAGGLSTRLLSCWSQGIRLNEQQMKGRYSLSMSDHICFVCYTITSSTNRRLQDRYVLAEIFRSVPPSKPQYLIFHGFPQSHQSKGRDAVTPPIPGFPTNHFTNPTTT